MPVRPTDPVPHLRGRRDHLPGAHRHEPGQRERVRDRDPGVRLAWPRPAPRLGGPCRGHVRPADPGPRCWSGMRLRRRWWSVVWTIVAGVVIVLLTLPIVGIGGYTRLPDGAAERQRGDRTAANNLDLGSTVARLGAGALGASLALYGGYALGIGSMLIQPALRPGDQLHGHRRRDPAAGAAALGPLPGDAPAAGRIPGPAWQDRGAWRCRSWPGCRQSVLPLLAIVGTLVPFVVRRPTERQGPPESDMSRPDTVLEQVPVTMTAASD